MLIGPVFTREAVTTPRRAKHYLYRGLYVSALLVLMGTAWMVLAGTQIIRNVGDMARFGSILFQILAPLQLAVVSFLAALGAASAVSQEKDRRTLILLLLTRMTNSELVLGKLMASMLNVLTMLLAALPVFMLATWFGGVSQVQVARVFAVTLATALAAGSLGSTFALWREKTFQTLSMTALALVIWVGLGEVLARVLAEQVWAAGSGWIVAASPTRAIMAAANPGIGETSILGSGVGAFLMITLGLVVLANAIAIARVRVWNPSREVRPGQRQAEDASIWGVEHDLQTENPDESEPKAPQDAEETGAAEAARAGHVDARMRETRRDTRVVWDNPILWREVCTWAYGRKVLLIRGIYLLLFVATWLLLRASLSGPAADQLVAGIVPTAALPLAGFFIVSLNIVNALAVTSITGERDGQAIDLLLVTDLSPHEFVLGKLGGVLWVAREMVVLPLFLCVYVWWYGGVSLENFLFVVGGLVTMNIFVSTLGIHCGMTYANSRSAILVSLGTVFFLFLGVFTCMWIMISLSGRFENQLAPFLAFILGGGVGLYVALGIRNPSQAIAWATLLLPFATFFAITSFLLDKPMSVFLVTATAYGFTAAAMMVPAIYEFDIAMGRTKTEGDE